MIPHLLIYIILSPLLGAIMVSLLTFLERERWRLRDATCFVFLLMPGLILLFLYPELSSEGPYVYHLGSWGEHLGIVLTMDGFSFLMVGAIGVITLASYVYSLGYLKIYASKPYFYFYYLLMTTGLYGLVLSGDIFNLYVFFELTVVSSYVLITFTGDRKSYRASFNYLITSVIASSIFIMAIAVLYNDVGTLNIALISERFSAIPPDTRNLFFVLFFGAVCIKSAIIPFHFWLPNAHAFAPTPISAILSGFTVKVGAYILIRFLFVLEYVNGSVELILAFSCVSAVAGALFALVQSDIKRLLAYHTISQTALVFIGIADMNIVGEDGAILHIINHGIFKALLFLCAGAVIHATGTRDLRQIKSIPNNLILIISLIVAALSISGVPPMNGFFSKEAIFEGCKAWPVIQAVIFVTTALTMASMTKLLYYVLVKPLRRAELPSERIPPSMTLSLLFLTPLCIVLGVLARDIVDVFVSPVATELLHQASALTVLEHPFSHLPLETMALLCGVIVGYVAVLKSDAVDRAAHVFHLDVNSSTTAIFMSLTGIMIFLMLW